MQIPSYTKQIRLLAVLDNRLCSSDQPLVFWRPRHSEAQVNVGPACCQCWSAKSYQPLGVLQPPSVAEASRPAAGRSSPGCCLHRHRQCQGIPPGEPRPVTAHLHSCGQWHVGCENPGGVQGATLQPLPGFHILWNAS